MVSGWWLIKATGGWQWLVVDDLLMVVANHSYLSSNGLVMVGENHKMMVMVSR